MNISLTPSEPPSVALSTVLSHAIGADGGTQHGSQTPAEKTPDSHARHLSVVIRSLIH